MLNRLKKAFLVLTAVMVLPAVAGAQTSRVQGMSLQGDYIKDYSNIYTYTSGVLGVGNLVYGELGSTSLGDRAVGAVLGNLWDGRYGTWAIHLRETTPGLGQGDNSSSPTGADDPNSNNYESFDLMWGRKFGTTSFGARLNRSFGKWESDPVTWEVGNIPPGGADPNLWRNVMGLGAGLGFELGPNASLETSLLYQSRTYEISNSATGAIDEQDGPTTMQLAARMFWQWQPNVLVVPVFKYYNYDLSNTASPGGGGPAVVVDNKWTGWQAGLAGNWTIGSDDLFVLGAAMAQNKLEFEEDLGAAVTGAAFGFGEGTWTQTYTPLVFAALETHVNSWLTLRLGANKGAWYSEKTENSVAGTEVKEQSSTFSMSLGAGVKIGALQLDGVLNDAIAHNGLYFVSGNTSSPLASKVTATYSF